MACYWGFFGYLNRRCLKELGLSLDVSGESKRDFLEQIEPWNIKQSVIMTPTPESQIIEPD